jgi:hypothetical protein
MLGLSNSHAVSGSTRIDSVGTVARYAAKPVGCGASTVLATTFDAFELMPGTG